MPRLGWLGTAGRLAFAALLVVVLVAGIGLARRAGSFRLLPAPAPPRVTHDLVVEQLRDVA